MTSEDMKLKIEFFFNSEANVHIRLNSNRFYNGKIIEVKNQYIILEDIKIGKMPVMIYEIERIEPYNEVRE